MRHQLIIALLAVAAFVAAPALAQQPKVAATPMLPTYGQPVKLELRDSPPTYLPGTRYTVNGYTVNVDYEYASASAGHGADFGAQALDLGELPPGNYTVNARLYDIDRPRDAPKVVQGTIAVAPPEEWGLYTVPSLPQAFSTTHAVIKSAAYFDPKSMKASLAGNVIRVNFDYRADAPSYGPPPAPGYQAYGSVRLPLLQPGSYRLEGWGRSNGGAYEKFFDTEIFVDPTTPVIEYYSATLDHYFMAMGADEIDLLDKGGQGDWKRTGQRFVAWSKSYYAMPGAVPVCRFYARGPNSHFFTGSKAECDYLKSLETKQRAEAQAQGKQFLGWGYEGIAFHALVPVNGQCMEGEKPVYRVYNGRASQNDSNHRFTADSTQYQAMMPGWLDENVQFCSLP